MMTAYVIKDKESGMFVWEIDDMMQASFYPSTFTTFFSKSHAEQVIKNITGYEAYGGIIRDSIDPANLTVVQIEWREKGE